MQVYERPGAPPSYWPAPSPTGGGFQPKPKMSRGARIAVVCSILFGLLFAGTGVYYVGTTISKLGDNTYPAQWDDRVAALASFVEVERGLEFDHPVAVNFLTDEEFREETTTDESSLSDEERSDLESWAEQTRALGLTSGKLDMHAALNNLSGDGTLAFYDPDTESVTVRGTEMTVGLEVTLVHELTHALQDQHFGLNREFDTDGADTAFRALVEGDAVRIENYYIDDLSDASRDAYWEEYDAGYEQASSGLDQVPEAVRVLFGAPYPLGEWFVEVVLTDGGQRALDRAFRNPPDSELALLNPVSWLDRETLQNVATPKLDRGEHEVEQGDLGALTLYTMLAARIDPAQALLAVDGWDGDAYVAFDKGGDTCVRFSVAGADRDATGRLHEAITAWAGTLAATPPTVTRTAKLVNVVTCDPGEAVERGPERDRVGNALVVPVTRSQILSQFLDGGFTQDEANCVGQGVITSFTAEQLADEDSTVSGSPAFDATMDELVGTCAGGKRIDPGRGPGTAA